MTVMAEAMKKAGIETAEDKLHDLTLKAMIKHADNTFAACDQIWREVSKDRELLVELFKFGWRREVSGLLQRVRRDIRGQQADGRLTRVIDRKAAIVEALISKEEGRLEREDRAENARAQAEADRQHQEHLAQWRATYIGRMEIGGTPVWELTPGTVRTWLSVEGRRHRTLELLIEGLPDNGRTIEYYRKPEDVAALWSRGHRNEKVD